MASFELFVSALLDLSSACDLGPKVDDLIRGQVVTKTSSNLLRERLLLEGSTLTLECALAFARSVEEPAWHSQDVSSITASANVGNVEKRPES
ncbi:hypothetical protein IscW_ISCW015492 [Ixodes scapularis]|uniref:Uncharacterized protein n=1 Tax=Ixodes scapularis TaxID=6945 RepID=B7QNA5_IXOSC|nr:hypothetical protein IscW_ISCW015492 [Ixodes scapularis]|eukprot:XP_002416410.1 hypothetical protein IscW_ISCW015492 [Ixodes scapularis]